MLRPYRDPLLAGGGLWRVHVILTTCYTKRLTLHEAGKTRL
jgi:hypothetical protein